MSYTLIVRPIADEWTDTDEYADVALFRRGKSPDDLKAALDYWTDQGYRCYIYGDLDNYGGGSCD